MKTIIKLLITAAILHAVVRSGMSAMDYYKLKDGAQQLLLLGDEATTAQLQSSILTKAVELDLPVSAENVSVEREGVRTTASVSYTQAIEFLPRYRYPVTFSFQVEALSAVRSF